jgi:hypothetical protein
VYPPPPVIVLRYSHQTVRGCEIQPLSETYREEIRVNSKQTKESGERTKEDEEEKWIKDKNVL